MSKYRAEKVTVDGIRFDSKDEARYYQDLKKRKVAGEIINFELQPKYELQPSFKKNGKKYQPIYYVADFLIYHNDGSLEVVDVKGMATPVAIQKRKEFDYHYPELKLSWITRSLKYSEDGWIDVDELKKIRAKNSKRGVS
ncbi:DUF1064 domain-containing protein [Clostridium pasteurianum]|uniref:DUF1064 domain-containing protein n=1 Tax=Clostridium pasteurianum BC1 TaxID=86416 RepID=R4K2P8_CLOPA|nr:DUF1064 domain-containing protein [Clostridium pasteurianum]AGK97382.1 Protein of unknown function (DUF1064) [Clostridium pasteurianum BC1]